MPENKTKPTSASVAEFIAAVPDETRRADAKVLLKMMRQATGEKPKMWGPTIVGFGSVHYRYASGREGEMPRIAFSPRKPSSVLYGLIGFKGADSLLEKLGPHSTGKGCLYIKRLANVDLAILERLIAEATAS